MELGQLALDHGRRAATTAASRSSTRQLAVELATPHLGRSRSAASASRRSSTSVAPAPQHLPPLVESGDLDLEVGAQGRDRARPLIEAGARGVGERARLRVGLFVGLERRQDRLELGRARVFGRNRLRERLMMGVERVCFGLDLTLGGLHAGQPVGGRVQAGVVLVELTLDLLAVVRRGLDGERARGNS